MPETIDDHARRQRVAGSGQPIGQLTPAAAAVFSRQRIAAENLQKSARRFVSQPRRFAPFLDASVGGRAFDDRVGDFIRTASGKCVARGFLGCGACWHCVSCALAASSCAWRSAGTGSAVAPSAAFGAAASSATRALIVFCSSSSRFNSASSRANSACWASASGLACGGR